MKCRLCSSGLYICMNAPLSTSACSSLVRVSDLPELTGIRETAAITKTLHWGFLRFTNAVLMDSIRARRETSFRLFGALSRKRDRSHHLYAMTPLKEDRNASISERFPMVNLM